MKTNYSSTRWGVTLTAFLVSGATHPVCATPSVSHGKPLKKSFIDTHVLDEELCDEEGFGPEDWQDSLTSEQKMKTSSATFSHSEPIVTAHVVSDEVAPFVWADDEPDVEDEILLPRPKTTPVNVVVVSREKPFIFHEDELECEDEILLPPPRRTPIEVEVVFRGRPPFVFRDEFEGEVL